MHYLMRSLCQIVAVRLSSTKVCSVRCRARRPSGRNHIRDCAGSLCCRHSCLLKFYISPSNDLELCLNIAQSGVTRTIRRVGGAAAFSSSPTQLHTRRQQKENPRRRRWSALTLMNFKPRMRIDLCDRALVLVYRLSYEGL